MIVYLITNSINGKRYVGVTTRSLERRFAAHKRSRDAGLPAAMRKYGIANFRIEKLADAKSLDEMYTLERQFISNLGTYAPLGKGYNLNLGGLGGLGTPKSDSAKQNMSAAKKRFLATPRGKEITKINFDKMMDAAWKPEATLKRVAATRRTMSTPEWRHAHKLAIGRYLSSPIAHKQIADKHQRGIAARSEAALAKKILTCGPLHLVGTNLYVTPKGVRTCRVCTTANRRRYNQKKREHQAFAQVAAQ